VTRNLPFDESSAVEQKFYGRLCAEFYDVDKPEAEESEVDYFARHLDKARGPALEAMCGSGRLLIPLLRRGYILEGVDNSGPMLQNLERRCLKNNLKPPKTYLQSVVELNLNKRYSLIFIALGSFQLLSDTAGLKALTRIYQHLLPDGALILDTFTPWELIRSETPQRSKRKVTIVNYDGPHPTTVTIHLTSQIDVSKESNLYRVQNLYERKAGDETLETEEEFFSVRWYSPTELLTTLSGVGFESSCLPIPNLPTPRRFVFEASKSRAY
jgi:SAM-dependent methyltransferase